MQIQIGDSVLVKPGLSDPDFGIDIGGWQGRICEIEAPQGGDAGVCIEWDSLTLASMPDALIEKSEEQGLDWTKMVIDAHEVEVTKPRDTKEDVSQAVEGLAAQRQLELRLVSTGGAGKTRPQGADRRGRRQRNGGSVRLGKAPERTSDFSL